MALKYILSVLGQAKRAIGYKAAPALLALAIACGRGESTPVQYSAETAASNSKNYTLVLVDFNRSSFFYPDGTIIGQIIDKTMENRMPIVTVEWLPVWITDESYRSKLEKYPYNTFIKKDAPDGFSNPDLEVVLQRIGNQKLVMAGGLGEVCLDSTARSAIDKGYKVVASDETSIESSDSVHNASLSSNSELAAQTVNSYKGVILWDRFSDRDYSAVIALVNGDFELRKQLYAKTIEEELKFAQDFNSSIAISSAEAYARKLGMELPIKSK